MTAIKPCAIIPVYNNAATIGEVVLRCRNFIEPDLLVVSDGSTDGSDDLARRAGAEVISVPENLGKGRAILTGLKEAETRGYTHAVVIDADGQHLPEEIPRMIDAAWKSPDRIWVGARRMGKDSTPGSSRIGRTISNFWATINSWQVCRDAQSGFRIYPVKETLSLNCREPGFTFEMEVLIRASWSGIKIGHMDIDVVYPTEERVSHFDMRRDNARFTWISFKMFWGMVVRIPMILYRKIARSKAKSNQSEEE